LGGLFAIAAIGAALAITAQRSAASPREVDYSELEHLVSNGAIRSARFEGERVLLDDGSSTAVSVVSESALRVDLAKRLASSGASVSLEAGDSDGRRVSTAAYLVMALIGGIAAFAWFRRTRTRGHFRSGSDRNVLFADVAGVDEAKEALRETVEFLRDPERFGRLGGRAPRGVLLAGEPGTGKTLLARAVATEASVAFLAASGSAFQEMFVGVGAQRVRALFAEARKASRCIVFIDEIDAIGRARARHADAATADHDQTLNQLLVEMDGFDARSGVVVIASTNRVDMLDAALLRPGRFDRQIVVPLPDLRGRTSILEVHAKPIALAESVDLSRLARATPGFSGAALANLMNEAAILAAREDAHAVGAHHLERARDLVLMGAERRGFMTHHDDRHATAVHESGHVIVGLTASHADPIDKVSILPRGGALGVTQSLPERDRIMLRREYLVDQLCLLMGGRAAEMVLLGTQTAGASDDIRRAATLARRMVVELGMSDLGPVSLGGIDALHGHALLDRIEETTRKLVGDQLERACRIVEEHRGVVERIVTSLLEHDTLDAAMIRRCLLG
jgi:cell division protease FtsH